MKRIREIVVNDDDLQITKLEDGNLEIRKSILDENGDLVYHRHAIYPGQFLHDEDARVVEVARTVHTRAVIDTWKAVEAERKASRNG